MLAYFLFGEWDVKYGMFSQNRVQRVFPCGQELGRPGEKAKKQKKVLNDAREKLGGLWEPLLQLGCSRQGQAASPWVVGHRQAHVSQIHGHSMQSPARR